MKRRRRAERARIHAATRARLEDAGARDSRGAWAILVDALRAFAGKLWGKRGR